MTKRDPLVRLRHMLDYAKEAVTMAKGKTAEELNENRQLNLALTHLVELIGEAASKIPRNVQARHHEIPWPKIISMRNRLIHGYDFVDYDILWDTVNSDLPPLIEALEKVISPQKN